MAVQKRDNIADRSVYKGGPWLAIGNFSCRGLPWLTDKRVSLRLNYLYKQYFMLNTWFSSGSLEFGICAIQRMPMWPASNKKPGCSVFNMLSWLTTFHGYCHNCAEGVKCIPWGFTERGLWSFVPDFPRTLSFVPFSFFDFVLPPFAVINHSHGFIYILHPPNKSSNLGMVLGASNIVALLGLFKRSTRRLQPWILENCPCFYVYGLQHERDWDLGPRYNLSKWLCYSKLQFPSL